MSDMKIRERFEMDSKFRNAVQMMLHCLHEGLLTTEDVAQAAVLAAQMYAETHGVPTMIRIAKEKRQ